MAMTASVVVQMEPIAQALAPVNAAAADDSMPATPVLLVVIMNVKACVGDRSSGLERQSLR